MFNFSLVVIQDIHQVQSCCHEKKLEESCNCYHPPPDFVQGRLQLSKSMKILGLTYESGMHHCTGTSSNIYSPEPVPGTQDISSL